MDNATRWIRLRCACGVIALAMTGSAPAIAQQPPSPVAPADPKTSVPEKLAPDTQPRPDLPERGNQPASPPGSLSDKLGRSDGVIRPPATTSPEIIVPAPVPEPNSTPVIPPPGSPGNPSPARPK